MSDRSVLSRQYERALSLASALEERLLHDQPGLANISPLEGEGWEEQRRDVQRLLHNLARMVDPSLGLPDPGAPSQIPASVVTRLRAEQREGHGRGAAIESVATRLAASEPLDPQQAEVLRTLAAALEDEASALHRRLVRR